jgi:uncharacterized membrane protein YfcA
MQAAIRCPYFQKALGCCVPIGGLAGLVGLGGGEFRLPVLMYVIGYPARTAVPLNLKVSLRMAAVTGTSRGGGRLVSLWP